MKHTAVTKTEARPRPYYVHRTEDGDAIGLAAHGKGQNGGWQGKDIAQFGVPFGGRTREQIEADAAFLLRACNAHDDLVAALRGMLTATDHWNDWDPGAKERAAAQAAIAKAEGQTP